MLTEKRVGLLVNILENKDKKWSINAISKSLDLSYPTCYDFVYELLKLGYIKKSNGGFSVVDTNAMIDYISKSYPFVSREKACFYATDNNLNKMDLIKNTGLMYAFTLFTGGELLHPYVHTDKIYLYVKKSELGNWEEMFIKKIIRKSTEEEANIILLPTEHEFYFKFSKMVNNSRIAPLSILISDLISTGSLGKQQGEIILDKWIKGEMELNG